MAETEAALPRRAPLDKLTSDISAGQAEERRVLTGYGAMSANDIRNWLGAYVLFLAAILGGYLFLAPASLLPLESTDRTSCFEVILPFLLGQVAAVYRFYTDPDVHTRSVGGVIPAWAVKGPPIVVTVLLVIELTMFALAGQSRGTPPTPELFKGLVTFCVALLNASTVFIITRYFDGGKGTNSSPVQAE
jgi:hypothetical protein